MDKVIKGIGYITIMYVGLYLLDVVSVNTGLDEKLERIFKAKVKTNLKTEIETNKVSFGFH